MEGSERHARDEEGVGPSWHGEWSTSEERQRSTTGNGPIHPLTWLWCAEAAPPPPDPPVVVGVSAAGVPPLLLPVGRFGVLALARGWMAWREGGEPYASCE